MDDLIKLYFSLGFQHIEILSCLAMNHDVHISRRTLQRKLRRLGLFRRKEMTDFAAVITFIEENVRRHGQLHGYRWMHLKCLQSNLAVTQEVVRIILHILDPQGVDIRRRRRLRRRQYFNKGPNYLWHMDCYDKLKPFGICISGCIDGFSRKIMWLRAGKNSSDPKVIAGYYLETVSLLGGCPQTLRADLGTENGVTEQIQTVLTEDRRDARNILPPFLYGTSPSNQRIEAWWAILRKHHSQYWLNVFHKLKDDGLFSGSYLDKSIIQFCFLNIIQNELDVVSTEWNTHRISSSRNSISPAGRPFMLYHLPEVYHAMDYLHHVEDDDITACKQMCEFSYNVPCDKDIYDLVVIIMAEDNLSLPTNPDDALDLYVLLRRKLLNVL